MRGEQGVTLGVSTPTLGCLWSHCLRTVLNEEREHHGFCVRDLDKVVPPHGAARQ
jgi:hypothetical protein